MGFPNISVDFNGPNKIDFETVDNDIILEKCGKWDCLMKSIDEHDTVSDSIFNSVKKRSWKLMRGSMRHAPDFLEWELDKQLVKDTIFRSIEDELWTTVDDAVCSSMMMVIWYKICDRMKHFIHESVEDAIMIHVYSQLSPKKYAEFLKPMSKYDKDKALNVFKLIKEVDWFWQKGICCFRGVFNHEYYLGSLDLDLVHKRIKI